MNLYTFVVRILSALDMAFGGRSQISLDVLASAIAGNINNNGLGTFGSFNDICKCTWSSFWDGLNYDDNWDEEKYNNLYKDFQGMVRNHLAKLGVDESVLPFAWYESVHYTPVSWYINPSNQFDSGIGEFIVKKESCAGIIRYYLVDNTKQDNVYIKELPHDRAVWHLDQFNLAYETTTEWSIGYPDGCDPIV